MYDADAIYEAIETGELTEDEATELLNELEAFDRDGEEGDLPPAGPDAPHSPSPFDSAVLALQAIRNMGDGDAAQQVALAKTIARVTLQGLELEAI